MRTGQGGEGDGQVNMSRAQQHTCMKTKHTGIKTKPVVSLLTKTINLVDVHFSELIGGLRVSLDDTT